MKIAVCIKQVVDSDDIKWTKNNTLDREGVESVVNPCDMLAIETAVRIKESAENTKITALTMGPAQACSALKTAIALGCDEAYLISDKKFSGADTVATSRTLAAAIKKTVPDFDLIICGQFASDGDTAQTGPSIAQKLDVEQITYVADVIKISTEQENVMTIRRIADEDIEIIQTPLPALICVSDCAYQARDIKINGYVKAQDTKITTLNIDDIDLKPEQTGIKGSPTYVSRAFRAISTRTNECFNNTSAENIANFLNDTIMQILNREDN